jgi:hypothetical protein
MKKQLVLLLFLICYFSCASQKKEIIAKSIIKLEGKNTNIRDLLGIDGYYHMPEYPDSNCRMFFEDGTWVDFSFKRNMSKNEIRANMFKSIVSWIENKQLRMGSYWGVYRTQNDTIIVYVYEQGTLWRGWSLHEERYKVIDQKTIQRIYFKGLLKRDEDYDPWRVRDNFHFTPADSLPSSDCWLKEEKWIWRHESDWKAYMQHVEQVKKQYKKK